MNLVDLHCDTLSKLLKGKGSLVSNNLQVDLAGMKMLFSVCMVMQAAAGILVVRYCLKKDKT